LSQTGPFAGIATREIATSALCPISADHQQVPAFLQPPVAGACGQNDHIPGPQQDRPATHAAKLRLDMPARDTKHLMRVLF
jgi:hypothetical protein